MEQQFYKAGVSFFRFNTDSFPWSSRVSADESKVLLISSPVTSVDFSKISAVWYRREATSRLPGSLDKDARASILKEIRCFLTSVYKYVETAPWVDRLSNIDNAEHKILQLRIARECGLRVPETLMTNDPDKARKFLRAARQPAIVKTLSPFSVRRGKDEMTIFTTTVNTADAKALSGLRFCPLIFQRKIEKSFDLRVTIVGDDVFPVTIDSRRFSQDNTDWRHIPKPEQYCTQFDIPKKLHQQLRRLMSYYGLHYGAIDLLLTPGGKFYFLELNPCGDWSWLPKDTQNEVASSLSKLLQRLASRKKDRRIRRGMIPQGRLERM